MLWISVTVHRGSNIFSLSGSRISHSILGGDVGWLSAHIQWEVRKQQSGQE